MTALTIVKEGPDGLIRGPWKDLQEKEWIDATGGKGSASVSHIVGGTKEGTSSVIFRIEAPTGEIILFETTLRLLKTVVDAFTGAETK